MSERPAVRISVARFMALQWIILLICLSSCGDDGGPGPGMTAVDYNEAGWSSYSTGSFASARESFEKALELEPGFTEARLGLGWCEAHAGEHGPALDDFNEVIEAGEYVIDALAGRAASALAATRDSLAITSADSALALDDAYEFDRHKAYNWRDLTLIMAQAHFALAQYGDAQAQVDILDPGNGLDPASPESWIVEGQAHPTYEGALAMEIERLWSLEGGSGLSVVWMVDTPSAQR